MLFYWARCLTPDDAKTSRVHNNANLLTLFADKTGFLLMLDIIDYFIKTPSPTKENEETYFKRYIQIKRLEEKIIFREIEKQAEFTRAFLKHINQKPPWLF